LFELIGGDKDFLLLTLEGIGDKYNGWKTNIKIR